jgi:hypothetical protein
MGDFARTQPSRDKAQVQSNAKWSRKKSQPKASVLFTLICRE